MLPSVKAMSSHSASDSGTKSPIKRVKPSFLGKYLEQGLDILASIRSKDRPTRRMGFLFWGSFGLIFLVSGVALERYRAYRQEESAARSRFLALEKERLDEAAAGRDAVALAHESSADLGFFNSTLPASSGEDAGPHPRAYVSADIEVTVLCDSPETRKFLESHLDQARSQALDVLAILQRDELLTGTGKRQLRARLIQRLNDWLGKEGVDGKALEVSFTDLVVH